MRCIRLIHDETVWDSMDAANPRARAFLERCLAEIVSGPR